MQITKQELKAIVESMTGSLLRELVARGVLLTPEASQPKLLADFSKTFLKVIGDRFKGLKAPSFMVGGEEYVSAFAITQVLGWSDWKDFALLRDGALATCDTVSTVNRWLEHDGGHTEIPKKRGRWAPKSPETVFVRLADVERLIAYARPLKGPKALEWFRKRHCTGAHTPRSLVQ